MKKIKALILIGVLSITAVALAACGSKKDNVVTIAIPNDTTNEARRMELD